MNLHFDPPAFQTLLLNLSDRSGIRADILEKDYYVTLMLKELAEKQAVLPAYFKGGTALYKAIGCIKRFSEDIDLTVSVDDCPSNNQAKNRLEAATKEYQCLTRNRKDEANSDHRGSITTIYHYTSVVDVDREDQLQRFGRVKIEATSFTVSEPHKPLMISPLILNYVSNDENITLSNSYDVEPFQIETIKLERIFIDKIFAAEFYYLRQDYFNTSKHIYDVVTLLQNAEILDMLSDQERVDYLVHLQRMEELERKGSALSEVPISEFSFIHTAIDDEALRREFSRMQNIYVLVDQYQISLKEFINGISALHDIFQSGKIKAAIRKF